MGVLTINSPLRSVLDIDLASLRQSEGYAAIVYRLGHRVFIPASAVRFRVAVPCIQARGSCRQPSKLRRVGFDSLWMLHHFFGQFFSTSRLCASNCFAVPSVRTSLLLIRITRAQEHDESMTVGSVWTRVFVPQLASSSTVIHARYFILYSCRLSGCVYLRFSSAAI